MVIDLSLVRVTGSGHGVLYPFGKVIDLVLDRSKFLVNFLVKLLVKAFLEMHLKRTVLGGYVLLQILKEFFLYHVYHLLYSA
jgi:hypothetical protein